MSYEIQQSDVFLLLRDIRESKALLETIAGLLKELILLTPGGTECLKKHHAQK